MGYKPHTPNDTWQNPFGYIFGFSEFSGGTRTKQRYYGSSTSSTEYSYFYIPTSLKTVTITGSNYIPAYAFEGCSNLTKITIGEGVTTIGNSAFYSCTGLRTVNWNIANCITAGSSVYPIFEGCISLNTVNIGAAVQTIPDYAFDGCYALIEICNESTLPIVAGETDYGGVAYYAKNVYSSNEGSSKLTRHGDYLFYEDSENNEYYLVNYTGNQTEISLPDMDYDYGINSGAFYSSDIVKVTIPVSVISIGMYAFYGCYNLQTVTFATEGKLESIGNNAFQYCSGLTEITIPASVTSIGSSAFSSCSGLTEIEIPASVTSIGSNAFYNCTNLQTVTFAGDSQLKSIGSEAFSGCYRLTEIEIPPSVIYIGGAVFSWCTGLQTVTFASDSKLESIGEWAFHGCSNLQTVNWNATNCTKAGWYESSSKDFTIFESCTSLATVNIGKNVQTIPDYIFYGCSSIIEITIPANVAFIGYDAFYGCIKLQTATFENADGWKVSTSIDMSSSTILSREQLQDKTTAAMDLKLIYCHYYWERG